LECGGKRQRDAALGALGVGWGMGEFWVGRR